MRYTRRLAALASGFVLYTAVVDFLGFLAAIAVPKSYFTFFGRQHATLALAMLDAVTLALPAFAFSTAWAWVTLRLIVQSPAIAAWWCLGGIAAAWAYRQIEFVLWYRSHQTEGMSSLLTVLFNSWIPPVWGVATALAVPSGLMVAAWMASRRYTSDSHSRHA